MSHATEAFARLTVAMENSDPACRNNDRFILDDQPPESLAYICRRCPLFDLCAEYAEIERPKGGIWAGKQYRTNQRKTKSL